MRVLVRYYHQFEGEVKGVYIYMEYRNMEMNFQWDARGGKSSQLISQWTEFICMYIDKNYFALLLVTTAWLAKQLKGNKRLESFNPERYRHSFPLELPRTLFCLSHISCPVTCASPQSDTRTKPWVPTAHRLRRPLFSLFSGGISPLTWASSPSVTYHLFKNLALRDKKRPKGKKLAGNLCCCFSNTTSPEAERTEQKVCKEWGLQGEKTQNSTPNKWCGHTVRCLWKKSNWEQVLHRIHLTSLPLGALSPY